VLQCDTSNVDSVMVAGRWRKRHGRLLDTDLRAARDEIARTLDYLLGQVERLPANVAVIAASATR
jgi:hypothetical protein